MYNCLKKASEIRSSQGTYCLVKNINCITNKRLQKKQIFNHTVQSALKKL